MWFLPAGGCAVDDYIALGISSNATKSRYSVKVDFIKRASRKARHVEIVWGGLGLWVLGLRIVRNRGSIWMNAQW